MRENTTYRCIYEFGPVMLMLGRCYLPACLLLMAMFLGFLIWIIVEIMSKNSGSYVNVLISVACLCVSLMFLLVLFFHYLIHRTTAIVHVSNADANTDTDAHRNVLQSLITVRPPAKMKNVLVDVDCNAMYLHVAESQTSPQALVISVYSTLDEPLTNDITHAIVDT
jgi:predicted PurR-regulated permease PerM